MIIIQETNQVIVAKCSFTTYTWGVLSFTHTTSAFSLMYCCLSEAVFPSFSDLGMTKSFLLCHHV